MNHILNDSRSRGVITPGDMFRPLLALAIAACAEAGVVHGIVLEHMSGRPMARTVVRLDSISGGASVSQRTGRSGQFLFTSVPAGMYLLVATRPGYFPAGYGQRLPGGRPVPVKVTEDSRLFTELQMRHKGVITGRVLDENGIGTPGVTVTAYRSRLPLRAAASGVSDDRGIYRIYGLEPARYWVRSAAHTLDDGTGWLPTYGPQNRETREAKVHQVAVEGETAFADVSPEAGSLYSIGGVITCPKFGPVQVSISSEGGQRVTSTVCSPGGYMFTGLAPGPHEILATMQDGGSAFVELNIQRDMPNVNLSLSRSPLVEVQSDVPVTLIARRQDLSESSTPQEFTGKNPALTPGYWEFHAKVPPGHYVESITSSLGTRRQRRIVPTPDAFEVFIEPSFNQRIRIKAPQAAGEIDGRVLNDGKPVIGAPVFLLPLSEAVRRSLGGVPETLSDTEGRFRFQNLPPGEYRILASFDLGEFDHDLAEASRAPTVKVEPSATGAIDLTVWTAPW